MSAVRRLLAGLLGAMAMIVWSFFKPPPLQQAFSDKMLLVTPGASFGFLIDHLQTMGKPLFYVGLTLLQLVLGAIFSLLLLFAGRASAAVQIFAGIVVGAIAWAVAWAVLGAELMQIDLIGGFLLYGAVAAILGLLLTAAFLKGSSTRSSAAVDPRRRQFLRLTLGLFGAGLAAGTGLVVRKTIAGIGEVGSNPPPDFFAPLEPQPVDAASLGVNPTTARGAAPLGMSPAITPLSDFYVVSKNFIDPTVDAKRWSLAVNGSFVEHPFTLTYDELTRLPSRSQYVTLECISNDVGGHLMSNARWTGVPLRDLLVRAGLRRGTKYVGFTCVDGYVESLPLDVAMHPQTLVAYLMDGKPLPEKHGFPARILTTGLYGMKNPKWLQSIAPSDTEPRGFWEAQGWSTSAVVKTTSRIDVPKAGTTLRGTTEFGGVAFAGARGIKRVEVSVDNGKNWTAATLDRPLSPYTWVLWHARVRIPQHGDFSAQVRAIDGAGSVQSAAAAPSYPSGASGYDTVPYTA
jgi:DMSO/TMAO reductase YedYZ molybdopterin-dependent catalytic subunit